MISASASGRSAGRAPYLRSGIVWEHWIDHEPVEAFRPPPGRHSARSPPPPAPPPPPSPRPPARRCGRSPTATRPSICSARSTCCPRAPSGAAPPSTRPRPASDTLVVETVIDESNPAGDDGRTVQAGGSPGLAAARRPRAGRTRRRRWQAAIAKSGIPAPVFDKLETWAAAFMLLGVQFKELGLDPGSGVESALKKQFADGRQADRPAGDQCRAARLLRHACRRRPSASSWTACWTIRRR